MTAETMPLWKRKPRESIRMVFWMCTGDCSNPAYLANVCVAAAAQRQGIGRRLIESAHSLAVNWGMMNL